VAIADAKFTSAEEVFQQERGERSSLPAHDDNCPREY